MSPQPGNPSSAKTPTKISSSLTLLSLLYRTDRLLLLHPSKLLQRLSSPLVPKEIAMSLECPAMLALRRQWTKVVESKETKKSGRLYKSETTSYFRCVMVEVIKVLDVVGLTQVLVSVNMKKCNVCLNPLKNSRWLTLTMLSFLWWVAVANPDKLSDWMQALADSILKVNSGRSLVTLTKHDKLQAVVPLAAQSTSSVVSLKITKL